MRSSCVNGFDCVGFAGGAIVVSVAVYLSMLWRRRTRRRYFEQNGGLQLEKYLDRSGRAATKLFSLDELQFATDNFSNQRKLGTGGCGTVFKGTLKDGSVVAIKKANRSGESKDNKQFQNELAILTQINHRHVVRLHGCCLETSTPLLVYEFVSRGTLLEHLAADKDDKEGFFGWAKRLEVARQTAEALAYLHAAAMPPILHRDVKTSNILLDDNLDAKVADFGVSRFIPKGEEHVSTAIQGTIGYLDPEYFQTLQLTEKSDVYSMGVVLVELITGLRAVDNYGREARFANLALLFVHKMAKGDARELIDGRLFGRMEGDHWDSKVAKETMLAAIMGTARLARRCLALHGVERPSMREMAEELRRIERKYKTGGGGGGEEEEAAQPPLSEWTLTEEVHVSRVSSPVTTTFNLEDMMPTIPR